MTKRETLYHELLKKEVVNKEDIEQTAKQILDRKDVSYQYIYNEYIAKLKQEGKLLHPKRGLYVAVPPTKIKDESFTPDKYLIASKVQKEYYLGYHTALEIHGSAYSYYNDVYIVVEPNRKFRDFEFKNIRYEPIYNSYKKVGLQKIDHKGQKIVVSSPSRTFLDCIDRPRYSGGWEECLKSLESLPGVRPDKLKIILESMDKDILYRKTGLILSMFEDNPYYEGVLTGLRSYLKENIGRSPVYLSERSGGRLNEAWLLYLPENFEDITRGV
ncbi:MAG: type IV toxin-antitoxin system AbiEi family antitoxin domain-containing protein [Thermoplasmatota archaeon]